MQEPKPLDAGIYPIDFRESNARLSVPYGVESPWGDLPCLQDGCQVVSCWHISFWKRLKLLFTGRIWVGILGISQAPMWLDADRPFQKEDSPEANDQQKETENE